MIKHQTKNHESVYCALARNTQRIKIEVESIASMRIHEREGRIEFVSLKLKRIELNYMRAPSAERVDAAHLGTMRAAD